MALQEDGREYRILVNATKHIKGVPGMTCELGLRQGGGSKYMIDALLENGDEGRVHITIDPYGSIDYIQSEERTRTDGPYTNRMMNQCMVDLYGYVLDKPITVLFFPLEDTEYFRLYGGGVPVYREKHKEILNTYACTYIDGPHNLECTIREAKFFAERSVVGSVIVFDDINNYYDHSKVKEYMDSIGWDSLEGGPRESSKASYIRVK